MRKLLSAFVLIGSLAAAHVALAAERTVTFAVQSMTCASCPYIVEMSMASVAGVIKVDASLETKTATVIFDDAMTTTDAIAAASANAGYPASPVQQGS